MKLTDDLTKVAHTAAVAAMRQALLDEGYKLTEPVLVAVAGVVADAVLTGALREVADREGLAFDADKAWLQGEVERLTALVMGKDVRAPGAAA